MNCVIQNAIKVIIQKGSEAYHNPEQVTQSQLFGMRICSVQDDIRFRIDVAAESCENWNFHDEAAKLREIVEKLN